MTIIEMVNNQLEEYKNLKADGHDPKYLDGFLQCLLGVLDYEQNDEGYNLKDRIFGIQERLYKDR